MRKAKSMLLCMLLTLFSFSVAYITATIVIPDTRAEIINPYEQDEGLVLSVSYDSGGLTMNTTGGPLPEDAGAYEYQYWTKQKVNTGEIEGSVTEQYIWQIARVYGKAAGYTISGLDIYEGENEDKNPYVENGKYNVIVRVKDSSGKVIDEIYGAYAPENIGKPVIESVTVNGRAVYDDYIVVNSFEALDVKITAKMSGLNYSVKNGNTTLASALSGDFTGTGNSVNISTLKTGQNIIEAKIEKNGNSASKKIKLYVVGEYVASERPVIESLTGTEAVDAADGNAELTLKIKYADGTTAMTAADLGKFNYKLTTGSIMLNSRVSWENITESLNADGGIDVVFSVIYGFNNYGIYQTTAEVSRPGVSGADDTIIILYKGYAKRAAWVNQTAKNSLDQPLSTDKGAYLSGVNEEIKIIPSGSITGDNVNITYAFYREDASGWVLIRNYLTLAQAPTFTWKPSKAGTYNIQVRIKDSTAGSYEAMSTMTYIVNGEELSGDLSVKFFDADGNETDTIIAGNAYKVEAVYEEEVGQEKVRLDDVLYMFTLTSTNLGTVYLNKFSASPYSMFIPGRADSCKITARVIKASSFGYKDILKSVDFNAYIQIELPQAEDTSPNTLTGYGDVLTGDGIISVKQISGETAEFTIDQNAKTVTYGGLGEFAVTFKTGSIMYVLPQLVTYIVDENLDEAFFDFDKSATENYSVDVSSLSSTPESLKINETPVPFSVDGTNLTVEKNNISAIDAGDYTAEIIAGQYKYIRSVSVVTKIINTAAELTNIFTYGDTGNYNAEGHYAYGGYFLLGGNIDATGAVITAEADAWNTGVGLNVSSERYTWGFNGIFDGRGYTVTGLKIGNFNGIFGSIGRQGVVKNVAFAGLYHRQKNNVSGVPGGGLALANAIYGGKVENVLIDISGSAPHSTVSAVWYTSTGSTIRDFVIYGDRFGNTKNPISCYVQNGGSFDFTNAYAITNKTPDAGYTHCICLNFNAADYQTQLQSVAFADIFDVDNSIWKISTGTHMAGIPVFDTSSVQYHYTVNRGENLDLSEIVSDASFSFCVQKSTSPIGYSTQTIGNLSISLSGSVVSVSGGTTATVTAEVVIKATSNTDPNVKTYIVISVPKP